jgi:hypothetical protein
MNHSARSFSISESGRPMLTTIPIMGVTCDASLFLSFSVVLSYRRSATFLQDR